MRPSFVCWTLLACMASTAFSATAEPAPERALTLYTRSRVESPQENGKFQFHYETITWDAGKTAVLVCDMWDDHYCKNAAQRVTEMAPRMNQFISEARKRGALIIHSPSGTMDVYADTPQRKLVQNAPKVELPALHKGWAHLNPEREPPMPVDTEQCSCDDAEPIKPVRTYSRQNDLLKIEEEDAIGDGVDVLYLLHQRGIDNLIIVGVHANMCVLGRPFGIRNMVYQGKNVLLVRDMTDAMYDPRQEPCVSHVRGTELVIEHVEKYWCPTITSSDLLGGPAFRFKEDKRPHVTFLVSDDHYHADKTLPVFAQMLRQRYGCHCSVLHGEGTSDIQAVDELQSADCLVLYVRRLALPEKKLKAVRDYLASGKPLVGLRTASHAFDVRGKALEGQAEWPQFDPEVLGGNYNGHGPNERGTDVMNVPEQSDHPILAGVEPRRWHSVGSLYYTAPINEDATLLMTGSLDDRVEPLTWVRTYKGGRVCYIGLGHPDDFKESQFGKLLVNAIFWAMDREVPGATTPTRAP